MKTSKALESAAFVAMFPGWWTTEVLARDSKGISVNVNKNTACSFCVIGLIASCYGYLYYDAECYVKDIVKEDPAIWNDDFAEDNLHVAEVLWLAAKASKAKGD